MAQQLEFLPEIPSIPFFLLGIISQFTRQTPPAQADNNGTGHSWAGTEPFQFPELFGSLWLLQKTGEMFYQPSCKQNSFLLVLTRIIVLKFAFPQHVQ